MRVKTDRMRAADARMLNITQIKEMVILREEGLSASAIGKRLGLSFSQVCRKLRKFDEGRYSYAGLDPRTSGDGVKTSRSRSGGET